MFSIAIMPTAEAGMQLWPTTGEPGERGVAVGADFETLGERGAIRREGRSFASAADNGPATAALLRFLIDRPEFTNASLVPTAMKSRLSFGRSALLEVAVRSESGEANDVDLFVICTTSCDVDRDMLSRFEPSAARAVSATMGFFKDPTTPRPQPMLDPAATARTLKKYGVSGSRPISNGQPSSGSLPSCRSST